MAWRRCTACTIDFSQGFWYDTLPCPMMFESAKLLATSTRALEWYKSCAHISFLSKVIQILIWANSMWTRYRSSLNKVTRALKCILGLVEGLGLWVVLTLFYVFCIDFLQSAGMRRTILIALLFSWGKLVLKLELLFCSMCICGSRENPTHNNAQKSNFCEG